VRCSLAHRPKHCVVLITVTHDTRTIAAGSCAIDGATLTASLRARHRLSRRGRTAATITTTTGSTTVGATIR
jgi:hypothetical protein